MKYFLFFLCLIYSVDTIAQPTALSTTNITNTTAELNWDDSPCAGAVTVQYKLAGSSWPGTVINGANSPEIITGLIANTSYEWRAKCSGSGNPWSTESFTTTALIYGCTDPLACNYDPAPYIDDGSCSMPGCTNVFAINFDPLAGCDDGSCAIPTISNAFSTITSSSCYGGTGNIQINVNQTTPPTPYNFLIGYYPFPGAPTYFISFGSVSSSASTFTFTSLPGAYMTGFNFGDTVQYYVRLVDSLSYYNGTGIGGSGTVTVGIYDEFGPVNCASFLPQPQVPFSGGSQQVFNVSCKGDSTGMIIGEVVGGLPPYTYYWLEINGDTLQVSNTISTRDTLKDLSEGSYSLKITDSQSCSSFTEYLFNVSEPSAALSIDSMKVISHIACYGDSVGIASMYVSGGDPVYSYLWDNGETGIIASALTSGYHTVSLTDDWGCEVVDSIFISEGLLIESDLVVDATVSCYGMYDGIASISSIGGLPPYTYFWSNGQTTVGVTSDVTSGLGQGSYYVTIRDLLGCEVVDSIYISQPTQLNVIIDDTMTVYSYCAGTNSGQLCAYASGGTPNPNTGYNYVWNDALSQTTACAYNLVAQANDYTVIVMDDRNCIASVSFGLDSITNSMNPDSVIVDVNNVSCFGIYDGSITASNVVGAVSPFSYTWTGPGGYTGSGNSIGSLYAGNYALIIGDDNDCAIAIFAEVLEPDQLEYTTYNVVDETFFGACDGQIWVNANGGTGNYYYDIMQSNSFPIPAANQLQLINDSLILNLCEGNYSIYLTDDNNCEGAVVWGGSWQEQVDSGLLVSGCTDSLALNFDPYSSIDNSSCLYCDISNTFNSSVPSTLSACDGFILSTPNSSFPIVNYNWSDSQGNYLDTTNFIINLCNDAYILTISDSAGCHFTDTLILGNISGCLDTSATNYDPFASIDDGSCVYPSIYGCTDSLAYNYDPIANTDDTSCLYCDLSFSIMVAQNSSPFSCDGFAFVTFVQGSNMPVEYDWSNGSTQNYVHSLCSGTYTLIITDTVGCIVDTTFTIGYIIISGCTDPLATNYDASATVDDGSCIYSATCSAPSITGLSVSDVIHDRVILNFDNMNSYDANGTQICRVDQIRIKYRELGTSSWSMKNMASPTGTDPITGVCNSTQNTSKLVLGLSPATTYEWQVKTWYCNGSNTGWSTGPDFTTLGSCPNVGNLAVSTPTTTKVTFTWDASNGSYSFVRLKARPEVSNPQPSDWFSIGGAGVTYGTNTKNKNGLTPGESYRGQARTWCDPNGGPYRSLWTPLIYWTQPTSVRLDGGESIVNLDVYPNPSRDVFNITFTSETVQDLRVRVLNVVGEEIISEDLQQYIGEYTKQIDLTFNAKGIYFLEIETSNGVINKKLILQ